MSVRRFRVALAQINPTVGDLDGNVRKIVEGMAHARELGCHIVAFPELAIPGYPPEDLLFKRAFIEANLRALDEVTRASRGLTAVVGFIDKRDDIFNAAAVLHDGARAGVYHKQYLPNYGVFDENRYFQAGTETPVFTAGDMTFAVNICEDIWYPTGPTTAQALAGAELIVTINGSPYHAGKARFREQMVATRAADDLVYLAFVNTVGGQDELVFDGASLIVDERGEVVARGRQFREDLVCADLDLDAVFRARLRDSRRRKEKLGAGSEVRRVFLPALAPALAAPDLPPQAGEPMLGPVAEVFEALVLGTRDYVTKNGFKHVVIGLSGGIDSALVAAIAVEALGRENVTGVTMPSPYSSAGTRADARRLARNLGIEFMTLPITPVVGAFKRGLSKPFKGLPEDVAERQRARGPRRRSRERLHASAVGRAATRPDRSGHAAAVFRARRHPGSVRRARSERGRHRHPGLPGRHRAPCRPHGRRQRVQAPAGTDRGEDHAARVRSGLGPPHRQPLPAELTPDAG